MKNKIKKFNRPLLVVGIAAFLAILAFEFGILSFNGGEIAKIKASTDITEQVKLYKKLIERVGPEKAQEDLFKSGLPFTGQTHLLNHTAGDYLYEKYGPAGLTHCKEYFLASCYHGFILHAIGSGGMAKVAEVFNECRKMGPTVFTQCAHAIGHGFLAYSGYKNLTQALKTCDEGVKSMAQFPAFNCYDGVFMENVWGIHNGGELSPDRWVNSLDPNYPCNDTRIDEKYIQACWSNQPALAFQFFRGDLKKVANLCNEIKIPKYRQMCFDGLSRQIHPLTRGTVEKTFQLCSLMPNLKWTDFCISVNAGASFSVGDKIVPFAICAEISKSGKPDCYGRLFAAMRAYSKNEEEFANMCAAKVKEDEWRLKCRG